MELTTEETILAAVAGGCERDRKRAGSRMPPASPSHWCPTVAGVAVVLLSSVGESEVGEEEPKRSRGECVDVGEMRMEAESENGD